MSFDKPTRNKLATMVGDCKQLLIEDIRDQLQVMYGLQPDGTALPIERLGRLDDSGRDVARQLREWQEHLASTEIGTEVQKKKSAFDRATHETAFTTLNRLAALRMCEERGHVIECVRRGLESDGFVLYERLSGGVFGTRGETYRIFLEHMFDELAVDLGVLFDRRAPQSLVFPRERCVEEVLSLLNTPELTHLWKEDETIGWIYQYFNSKEEREAMREASAAPRNSRELAVRNQFFTPRYVVEFLVDNTLGRIWYEMRKGDTALKEACHYLVRRPTEIFLNEGEQAPAPSDLEQTLTEEEPSKEPVYVPHRLKKDPRDLKILDPACGSGHFLIYAFDLLETIYEEAWAVVRPVVKSSSTGRSLGEDYPDLDDLKRALPELILRYNLHGTDIDLRACQIAALALWLRSQRAYQRLGLNPARRPKITRSNIVCAEQMPGESQFLDQFLADIQPKVLGQLVQVAFEKMKLAGEAGPLLKIEEEIAGAVADAKKKWLAGPKPEQTVLFGELRPRQNELSLDFSGITDETFWEKAEERIYAGLQTYAEQAENGHGYQRRLFADDTAHGFAFIDLCRKRYDAVLMNPPFGELSVNSKDYLFTHYDESKNDIYAAFVTRGVDLLLRDGELGALTSRTGFFLTTLQEWREQFITKSPISTFVDLGLGVLDSAAVEACCFTVEAMAKSDEALFVSCLGEVDKGEYLRQAIESGKVISASLSSFKSIPTSPFAYWSPPEIRALFARFESVNRNGFRVRQGLGSSDNFRFLRLWWEVPQSQIGKDARWVSYAKGGGYLPFWADQDLCVLWENDGREIKQFSAQLYGSWSKQITNVDYYFRIGLTYSSRSSEFSPRTLPRGSAFDTKGSCIFDDGGPDDSDRLLRLLAILQSTVFRALLNTCVARSGDLARSYTEALVEKMPIPHPEKLTQEAVLRIRSLIDTNSRAERWFEETHAFALPCMKGLGLPEITAQLQVLGTSSADDVARHVEEIDQSIKNAYGLAPNCVLSSASGPVPQQWFPMADNLRDMADSVVPDVLSWSLGAAMGRWDIRFAIGEKPALELCDPFLPLPVCPPGQLQNEQGLPLAKDDVDRLQAEGQWSYPLEIPWEGILVDDPGHANDIIGRVREALGTVWKDRAEAIEQEACEILGVKDLGEYFRKPALFFAGHLKHYSKSRRQAPIYLPLSTASGSYTLWIYYHRLNDDLFYTALNKYVKPKIDATEKELRRIESELPNVAGREASALRTAFERTTSLLDELREFRDEMARVAELPYKPNLNDGVLITASPLWKLFRLQKWRRDLEGCWRKLETGEYDWAHLAYSIWPERVREACRHDRSIAIAHGLEELCEVTPKPAKKKRSTKEEIEETVLGEQE
jgi:hypothetical protein